MMIDNKRRRVAAFVALISLYILGLSVAWSPALAHERRPVDDVEFVVGFMAEPAVESVKNGVDLRVRTPDATGETEAVPVEGLEETLEVEITHVPSGVSRTLPLRALFGDPGHYTADLIPTAPGQYRFRFVGSIQGRAVDETFESGPGRFGNVESSIDLQFPLQVAEARELESALRGVQQRTQDATDALSSLRNLAIGAVVLGAAGLVTGVGALFMARRGRE